MCFASWPIEIATNRQPIRANTTASGVAPFPNAIPLGIENATAAAGAMCVMD